MRYESGKNEPKSGPSEWDSPPAVGWTGKKAQMFWDWFLEVNDISKFDFLEELKRDNNPANAIERLFAKMNKSAAMRRKKPRSEKRGRAH